MAAQITFAGESLIAQKQGAQQVLDVARCVFANVPGLNVDGPVDRAAAKPPAAQIVHTATIPAGNKGYVNPNQVVYSVQLGSDVGDWEFNWVGLESAEGVLFAVAYVPVQQKRRNIPPAQIGNNITRNFLIVFDGAQALTNITIDASTWQHDFTVRLKGIDERERVSNRDVYGRACFFGDSLQLEKAGAGYRIKPGLAYVEGIRVALAAALPVVPPEYPTKAWLAVALRREQNDVIAQWGFHFAPQQDDYMDGGVQVYCVPVAELQNSASVADLRSSAPIAGALIDHFAAKIGYYPSLTAGAADKLAKPVQVNGVPFDGSGNIIVADSTKLPLAGGTMTGAVSYDVPDTGGATLGWRERQAAIQLSCPKNQAAYQLWKASNNAERTLAGMDVYASGGAQTAPIVMLHVGVTDMAFVFAEGGNLSIAGAYSGNGSGLTNLNAGALATGRLDAARLSGTYDINISGKAASAGAADTATKLATVRTINGVGFDGSGNITVADSTKLPLAGGTMTGAVSYDMVNMGGGTLEWRDRLAAVQLSCPSNQAAYQIWKASNNAERKLAGMDVYAGNGSSTAPIVMMHVGSTNMAFVFSEGGNLSIAGAYSGNGSGLTQLNAGALVAGRLDAARLSGTYDINISGKAASAGAADTATRLATVRTINGVGFDGSGNITVADSTKLPLAGGTMTGAVSYEAPDVGGGVLGWRARKAAIQLSCPNNQAAYQLWKASNNAERHLVGMDIYAGGGSANAPMAMMHVGQTDMAFVFSEGGNLSIAGTFNGNGSGLTNLPAATPTSPGVVKKNTALLSANGWWKCAETGFIKQWGLTYGAADTVNHRSFPIAFPNACLNLVATRTDRFYDDVTTGTNALIVSREKFSVITGPFDSPDLIYWEATGY